MKGCTINIKKGQFLPVLVNIHYSEHYTVPFEMVCIYDRKRHNSISFLVIFFSLWICTVHYLPEVIYASISAGFSGYTSWQI